MKYPNNLNKNFVKTFSYSNRGMDLEAELNETNEYYLEKDRALIFKKPTPIGLADVSYNEKGRIINKAYFKEPSTLDYNGLYKGKYIEFEAKVTQNKTSFPIQNIHPHQIEHLKKVLKHHGIVFLIIKINDLVYLLKGTDFVDFLNNSTRKSIPYDYLQTKGYLIKYGYNPVLDYLKIVDEVYKEEFYEKSTI